MQALWLVVYWWREQGRASPVVLCWIYWVCCCSFEFLLICPLLCHSSSYFMLSMLIVCSLFEGTIHFVAIHLRWLGKCLKRILQKRLHDIIIIFYSMIFYVTTYLGSLHDIISKTWTSCLSAFRFGGYRRRWESNLKLQSVPNRNMKGFKMYYSLLCLHSHFSNWSMLCLRYQFPYEVCFNTICPLTSESFREWHLDSNYTALGKVLTL
jgi:hypothetical protein